VTPVPERQRCRALSRQHEDVKDLYLRDLFTADPGRGERLVAEGAGLYLDYSKSRITMETIRLLLVLADECGLHDRRQHVRLLGFGRRPQLDGFGSETEPRLAHDSSTNMLIRRNRAMR
jgi:hypothetical protein